jgi:hypothetical protein
MIRKLLETPTYRQSGSFTNDISAPDNSHNTIQGSTITHIDGVTQLRRTRFNKYGLDIAMERTDRTYHTIRQLAFKLLYPMIGGFSVVELETALRTSVFGCPGISFHLRTRNVIATSSDIVQACKSRNLGRVQEIFLRRAARPDDTTDDRRPLLWVGILVFGRSA